MAKIKEYSKIEKSRLASYAVKSLETLGRINKEKEHEYRSPFQRDRDRIIHSNAFRRLEYKTQVFVYHEGDHYRTRLTHTMEVAQIARTIARALNLNEDLAEAIALAHDLGHPPFGHTGEDVLNKLMKDYGGFEHNHHTLRIVDKLEKRYSGFEGLNLTYEVREGIAKHGSDYDKPKKNMEFNLGRYPSLEGQIADIADEIAYNNHDIDDGLSSEMITLEQLSKVTLWKNHFELSKKQCPKDDLRLLKFQTIRRIINAQVSDLVENVFKTIEDKKITSVSDIRKSKKPIARFSDKMMKENAELKKFLYKNLYNHYRVLRMASKAELSIKDLFRAYMKSPKMLPPTHFERINKKTPKERVICDYVAGMTDRYAIDEHERLFNLKERV